MKDSSGTVIVNISQPEKKLLKSLNKDARWGIKKAEKGGLSVSPSSSDKDWEDFYRIYTEVVREGGGMIFTLDHLKKTTSELLVCKKSGRVVGGGAIWFSDIYKKDIPRLYVVGSERKYLDLQPNNLIYWSCILWAKSRGYKEFDLGGWQINARGHLIGVNKFKEKWGRVVIFEKDYPFFRAIARKIVRNFPPAKFLLDSLRRRN